MPMNRPVGEDLLPRLSTQHVRRGQERPSRKLDALCRDSGYERKHTSKLLRAPSTA